MPAQHASFIRVFHRWSGLLLIVFLLLKILLGYSIAGNLAVFGEESGYRIHYGIWVDIPVLFLFVFHASYGILKIILSRGIRDKRRAFWVTTALAFLVFSLGIIFIYFI